MTRPFFDCSWKAKDASASLQILSSELPQRLIRKLLIHLFQLCFTPNLDLTKVDFSLYFCETLRIFVFLGAVYNNEKFHGLNFVENHNILLKKKMSQLNKKSFFNLFF